MIKITFELSLWLYVLLLILLLVLCVLSYIECYYAFVDSQKITFVMKVIEGTLWLLMFGKLALVLI